MSQDEMRRSYIAALYLAQLNPKRYLLRRIPYCDGMVSNIQLVDSQTGETLFDAFYSNVRQEFQMPVEGEK